MSSSKEEYDKRLYEIIGKLHTNEISEAELQEIDQWYDSVASNEKYSDGMSDKEKLQAKAEMLKRINIRIHQAAIPLRPPIYHYFKKIAIAAILLVIAGGSIILYQQEKKLKFDKQVIADKIAPGSNKAILTLSNGQKIALDDSKNGQLAIQSGIRISKTANGQLIYELSKGNSTSSRNETFNTIEVPVGGQWQAILSDGSHVWLNAQSSITFPTLFIGKERKVDIKGEAYFEVAHNKAMPFKVSSLGQTIEVLGTHFNVMAYPGERLIKTTLLQGSVKISGKGREQILRPGEQALASADNLKISSDIDIEDVVAWKDGYFKFNENLKNTMTKIARWYNVEVVYEDEPDNSLLFGGEVSRTRDIKDVLDIIEYTGKAHFKIEGRRIIVKK